MLYDIIISLNNVIINQEKTNLNNQIIPNKDIILTIKEIQKDNKILLISNNSYIKIPLIKQWLKNNLPNLDVLFFNKKETLNNFKCNIFFDTDKDMLNYMKDKSKYIILVDLENKYSNEKYLRNTSYQSIKESIDYIKHCLNLNPFILSSGKDINLLTISKSKEDIVSKDINNDFSLENFIKNALENKPTDIYIPEIEKERIRIQNLKKKEKKKAIKDKILFLIHNENTWNENIDIYCFTDKGDIFFIENFELNIPLDVLSNINIYFKLKNKINEKIGSINKLDLEKLLKAYNEISNNDIQTFHLEKVSNGTNITKYYMLNDKLSSNPILIGIRDDIDKYSDDIMKKLINNLLENLLKNKL